MGLGFMGLGFRVRGSAGRAGGRGAKKSYKC